MAVFLTHEERAANIQSLKALEDEITELAGHINCATYRFLKLLAEFDRRGGWRDWQTQSCAHWLNWKCGIDMGAAREKLRTAHALEKLPKIAAAMECGRISYSKVRSMTRVACPATEDSLLNLAYHGSAQQMEITVRQFRRCMEAEELSREARQQSSRRVTFRWDDDGSLILKACLPAEVGALVMRALDIAMKELPEYIDPLHALRRLQKGEPPPKEPPPTMAMLRADALAVLAESFLEHGSEALNGGDRHQVVLHVAAETLRDGTTGCCEIEDGPSIAAETARRLSCDASVVAMIENEKGEPLNVGRKTRTIHPALRRALQVRDKGCRFPGCHNTRFVDAHHVKHWANGGETKPSNLVTLCRFHHRAVHEGRVDVEILDDGAFRFIKPDGERLDSVLAGFTQPLSDWTELPARNAEHGIHITPRTATKRWGGTIDYNMTIAGLVHRAQRGRDVSAETAVIASNEQVVTLG